MKSLEGKVAIVTGSARGIGFGITKVLAEKGASVVISDVREEAARQAAEELKASGANGIAVAYDVSRLEDGEKLCQETLNAFGIQDIRVNNAGINKDMMAHKMTEGAWTAVINVNLTGVYLC